MCLVCQFNAVAIKSRGLLAIFARCCTVIGCDSHITDWWELAESVITLGFSVSLQVTWVDCHPDDVV